MKTAAAQPFITDRLRASAALAGVPIMEQLPEWAKAADIEAAEAKFEAHLATEGLVLVVMRPQYRSTGTARGGTAVSLNVCVPLALYENAGIQRITEGSRIPTDSLYDDLIAAVLCDDVTFPPGEIGRIDLGEGLTCAFLEPHVTCVVRAAAPA